ncbi:MAG TPA: NrsF family protein [Acidocella sp.]|jgi:hypothetical protein|uniref:NrsF family protein n=1 Tax=Acidocella sp. TaxID=50710 RepID=UPI002C47297D|nr:NrsF family protein [Acidocella sp.]HVE21692.1 NrsF family protein [Acidocella sp.]
MSDTIDVIKHLAREAGQQGGASQTIGDFNRLLLTGTVGAFALAFLLVCLAFAGSFDPGTVLRSYPFHFKIGTMALLAAGAFLILRQQGIPGASLRIAIAALPGPVALLFLAIFDRSGYPLFGQNAASVPICFFAILGASLPALLILLRVMRRAVVTRPGMAGAAAGLLAGALGAAAYAIACENNGALFVFTWYGLSIAVVCVLGALLGQRYLRW